MAASIPKPSITSRHSTIEFADTAIVAVLALGLVSRRLYEA